MKIFHLTLPLLILNIFSYGQGVKTEDAVDAIKSKTDRQTNLKDFVIAPTIFNNKGQTFSDKFSYKFLYDISNNSLVKIEIINAESKEIQSFYFSNDQLVLVNSKKENEYFFDSDFDIPYWGAETNKLSIKRDKFKETAYRLLIRFKKYLGVDK